AQRASDSFTLSFFNRPIVVLRATVLGHGPEARAVAAERLLDDLVRQRAIGPVGSQPFDGGTAVTVGARGVIVLTAADIDDLAGEPLEGVAAQAAAHLQQALDEASEARAPGLLLRATATALVAIALAALVLWSLGHARQRISTFLVALAERRMTRAGIVPLGALRVSRVLDFQRHVITGVLTAVDLILIYAVLTFVLRQFPYTRVWGESMSGFLLTTAETLTLDALRALPGLFTAALILVIARVFVRLAAAWFTAVERGQAPARRIHPGKAQPTRPPRTPLGGVFARRLPRPPPAGAPT